MQVEIVTVGCYPYWFVPVARLPCIDFSYIASPCVQTHAVFEEWSVCIVSVNSLIYWARGGRKRVTGKRLMFESIRGLKMSHAGIRLTLWPHRRWWGFCMPATLTKRLFEVCCDSTLFCSVCLPGNGYIEGKELENFFRELEMARRGAGVVSSGAGDSAQAHMTTQASPLLSTNIFFQDPSNPTFREKMKEFMQKFDKNKDGRIEMSEVRPSRRFLYLHWRPVMYFKGMVWDFGIYQNCKNNCWQV